jgi:hypothetical protein
VYDDPLDVETEAQMWAEVVGAMTAANTISPANGPMIARLVRFRIEFDRAARRRCGERNEGSRAAL